MVCDVDEGLSDTPSTNKDTPDHTVFSLNCLLGAALSRSDTDPAVCDMEAPLQPVTVVVVGCFCNGSSCTVLSASLARR